LLVQATFNETLTETTGLRLVRHGFMRIELHELLKAQPILDLFFRLRVSQQRKH
jgi:hypothetical protein